MHRAATALLVAVTLVVFAIAGYVLFHDDPVRDAGSTPALPSALDASTSALPTPSPARTSSSSARGPLTVAFLGDDWTAGIGADGADGGFAPRTAKALGLQQHSFGVDQSGYATGDDQYSTRVDDVVRVRPDAVVVSGGRNDVVADDIGRVAEQARRLFEALRQRLPQARIIAVAPFWGDSAPPSELATVAKAVQRAVTSVNGTYLDLPDPVRGHPGYMFSDADPGSRGYAAIARALAPTLKPLLPSR